MSKCSRLLTAALLLVLLIFAVAGPAGTASRVVSVEPAAGKVGDTVTVVGENLDKKSVVMVYLSDSATDYKATVVEQTAEKIVVRIPKVKPGEYNVSIQVRNDIFIQPVRFVVEE